MRAHNTVQIANENQGHNMIIIINYHTLSYIRHIADENSFISLFGLWTHTILHDLYALAYIIIH